jgi:hypothetical protein
MYVQRREAWRCTPWIIAPATLGLQSHNVFAIAAAADVVVVLADANDPSALLLFSSARRDLGIKRSDGL